MQDPTSEVYQKAIEMTAKAPQLHVELQKQLQSQSVRLPPITYLDPTFGT